MPWKRWRARSSALEHEPLTRADPYTTHPGEAFSIAQTSTALALTAIVLYRPLRPVVASIAFLCAVWMTAIFPDGVAFVLGLGAELHHPFLVKDGLRLAGVLATVAMLLARPRWIGVVALGGAVGLSWLCGYLVDSDQELCAVHLAWYGALLGVHQLADVMRRAREPRRPGRFEAGSFLEQDIALAALAIVLASLVATFVTLRECDSADEWAYTFQAAVFARFHAFARAQPCASALQMFWVFTSGGRMFSQYTPGWPLFMAPFVAVGVPWLAAPFSLGLLVVAIARLARRAAAGASGRPDVVDAAGPLAALFTMTSSTILINGGSRFPHVFSAACFAWTVEALSEIAAPRDPAAARSGEKARIIWGVVLGIAASWLIAARPADGATLGTGIFLYFLVALARRRLEWRPIAATTLAFALWGGLSLVILRLQLGKWFVTGYSLTQEYYPWAIFKLTRPKPDEFRWGIPLGTGSYCWWPLSTALGIGGLVAALRPGGRSVAFMLAFGPLVLLGFCSFLEYGRGWDFGYGPRYVLPVIVPMAVGTGVMLAPLWAASRRRAHEQRALFVGGPALLAVAAAAIGVVRLAPLLYPNTYEDVHMRNSLNEAVRKADLDNAIVWIKPGMSAADPKDLTQNFPLDLYPADAILAIDTGEDARRCMTSMYPRRRQYRASSVYDTTLVPE